MPPKASAAVAATEEPIVEVAEVAAPSRARPSRDAVTAGERQRRRRFSENDEGVDFNFWVDESKLDRKNFSYRWVNDVRGRVAKLESQDWERVSAEEAGGSVDRHADIENSSRAEMRAVLMRKPKDWYDDDHKRKQVANDDRMRSVASNETILKTAAKDANVGEGGLDPRHAYTPNAARG